MHVPSLEDLRRHAVVSLPTTEGVALTPPPAQPHHAGDGPVEARVSVPNVESTQRIAQDLLGRELVTRVQVLGPAASFYAWEGRVRRTHEWLLVATTTEQDFPRVAAAVVKLHPYEVPEIVAVPAGPGNLAAPAGGPEQRGQQHEDGHKTRREDRCRVPGLGEERLP